MNVNRIVAELDAEISRLQQIREALQSVEEVTASAKGRRGRPKGSKNAKKAASVTAGAAPATKTGTKRKLSPEGRSRIAEAMKRRWAAQRKAAS